MVPESLSDALDPLEAFMTSAVEENDDDAYSAAFRQALLLGPSKATSSSKFHAVEKTLGGIEEAEDNDQPQQPLKSGPVTFHELAAMHTKKKILAPFEPSSNSQSILKNIYVQVREVSDFTEEHVERLRQGTRIRGKNPPRPIGSFSHVGLNPQAIAWLSNRGIRDPTGIQAQAIPALLCWRDMIAVAPTGSGKTLAYLICAIKHCAAQEGSDRNGPIALILAPTRELVIQISNYSGLATEYGLRLKAAFGGTPLQEQLGQLKGGCEILVATPGRAVDVFTASGGKVTNLNRCSFVVLDEADRMLDMGFEPQIRSVFAACNPLGQRCMFSATFPKVVEGLARLVLKKPLEIMVGHREDSRGMPALEGVAERVLAIGSGVSMALATTQVPTSTKPKLLTTPSLPPSSIRQFLEFYATSTSKLHRLLQLLGEWSSHASVLVFAATKEDVDELFAQLLNFGYKCLTLHGGMDQSDRENSVREFCDKKHSILLATAIASRGLDAPGCRLVVNYCAPDHVEDYVHKVGRTGRGGKGGMAVTFLTPDDAAIAQELIDIVSQGHEAIPPAVVEMARAYAAQVAGGLRARKRKAGFGGHGFTFQEVARRRVEVDLRRGDEAEVEHEEPEDVAQKSGVPPPPSGPRPTGLIPSSSTLGSIKPTTDPTTFTDELPINDYPAIARVKANSRELKQGIEQRTGCRIALKGVFAPPGQKVPAGEKKLYLEISGSTNHSVQAGKRELYAAAEQAAIATLNLDAKK